jgi:protein TonB
VKRLILAAIVAIGIHILLMSMNFGWMDLTEFKKPSTGAVTIILESIQPQTTKTQNAFLPSNRYPQEIKRSVVETAAKNESPLTPAVKPKPIEAVKKPEKKTPIVKPAPAKQVRPIEPKKPAPPDQAPQKSPEFFPDESSQGAEASLPPPREEPTAVGTGPVSAVPNQLALTSATEEAQPEYSKNPPIAYPNRARRKGYEGTVLLEVLVNRNGTVDDLRILASSGYAILDSSAVKSVKTWSFKPAKKGKNTVDMWVQVPVRFKLE